MQNDKITEDDQLYELSIAAQGRKEITFYSIREVDSWLNLQALSPGYRDEIGDSYQMADNLMPVYGTIEESSSKPVNESAKESATESVSDLMNREYPTVGITAKKKVNVRNKPSTSGEKVTNIANSGTKVTILGGETNPAGELWYRVQLENKQEGYILADLIRFEDGDAEDDAVNTDAEPSAFPFFAKTNARQVNVREKPDVNSRKITRIAEKGTIVTVLDEVNDEDGNKWYKISLDDNREGYIKSSLLDFFQ